MRVYEQERRRKWRYTFNIIVRALDPGGCFDAWRSNDEDTERMTITVKRVRDDSSAYKYSIFNDSINNNRLSIVVTRVG